MNTSYNPNSYVDLGEGSQASWFSNGSSEDDIHAFNFNDPTSIPESLLLDLVADIWLANGMSLESPS